MQRTVAGDGGPAATFPKVPVVPVPAVLTLGDLITGPRHFGPRVSQGERKRAAALSRKTVKFGVHKCVDFCCNNRINKNSSTDTDMLTYSNDTFGGGFIIDTSLDEFGNKVGAARNMEYICIDKHGGRVEMDTVVDGGGSRVGVGRVDVVEEVGGRNNGNNNSVGGSEVAYVETGGVGGVDNNNDNNKQQHVTTHTTHNTHTYSKSIIRNTP